MLQGLGPSPSLRLSELPHVLPQILPRLFVGLWDMRQEDLGAVFIVLLQPLRLVWTEKSPVYHLLVHRDLHCPLNLSYSCDKRIRSEMHT